MQGTFRDVVPSFIGEGDVSEEWSFGPLLLPLSLLYSWFIGWKHCNHHTWVTRELCYVSWEQQSKNHRVKAARQCDHKPWLGIVLMSTGQSLLKLLLHWLAFQTLVIFKKWLLNTFSQITHHFIIFIQVN